MKGLIKKLLIEGLLDEDLPMYHGNRQDFAEFDMYYIGKGDQADEPEYGWGLYFTDNPKIAQDYANDNFLYQVSLHKDDSDYDYIRLEEQILPSQLSKLLIEFLKERGTFNGELSIDSRGKIAKYNELMNTVRNNREFDEIQAEIDRLESEPVKNSIKNITDGGQLTNTIRHSIYSFIKKMGSDVELNGIKDKTFNEIIDSLIDHGHNIYWGWANNSTPEETSKFFKRAGIDGIKYKSPENGYNGFNYVVFSNKDVTIERKINLKDI